MTEHDDKITAAAKAFTRASTELGEAMLAKLQAEQPQMAETVAHAYEAGRRLQLRMEFDDTKPAIRWVAVDDYETTTEIMRIEARAPTRQ